MKITDKDLRRVVRDAEKRGWTASKTNGGHIRLTKPGCQPVFTSQTPSDKRTAKNAEMQLRRNELSSREPASNLRGPTG